MTAILPNPLQFESAVHSSPAETLAAHVDHAAVLSIRGTPHGACQEVAASIGQAGAATSKSELSAEQPFFSVPLLPSAEITAELEAGIASIVADLAASKSAPLFLRDPSPEYLAANSSHMALRSFASNSTFIPTT